MDQDEFNTIVQNCIDTNPELKDIFTCIEDICKSKPKSSLSKCFDFLSSFKLMKRTKSLSTKCRFCLKHIGSDTLYHEKCLLEMNEYQKTKPKILESIPKEEIKVVIDWLNPDLYETDEILNNLDIIGSFTDTLAIQITNDNLQHDLVDIPRVTLNISDNDYISYLAINGDIDYYALLIWRTDIIENHKEDSIWDLMSNKEFQSFVDTRHMEYDLEETEFEYWKQEGMSDIQARKKTISHLEHIYGDLHLIDYLPYINMDSWYEYKKNNYEYVFQSFYEGIFGMEVIDNKFPVLDYR